MPSNRPKERILLIGVALLLLASSLGCESPLRRRFDSYERTGDWKSAVATLRQRVRVAPRDPEAHFLLGRAYLAQEEFAAARQAFVASKAISPKYDRQIDFVLERSWRLQMALGNEATEADRVAKAVYHYAAAVALKPEEIDGLRALGDASLRLGHTSRAAEAYQQVVHRASKDWRTRNNLSEAYFRLGDYEGSAQLSEETLRLKPDCLPALQRLGYAYAKLRKNDQAFASFERALEARFDVRVARDYARLAMEAQEFRRAVSVLLRIVAQAPADTAALMALADSYLGLTELGSAARTYEKLLAIDPAAENVRRALRRVYLLQGDKKKALGLEPPGDGGRP